MDADREFARVTAEKGVDGWVEFFAENGAMLPAGRPLVRGKQDIQNLMNPSFEDQSFSLVWEPTEADISASGDLGYTIGRYESTAAAADGTTTTLGKYVTIWKKQPDGSWKVVVDIGTPDHP
jgi:ketosteroid isomerase-like protein